MHSVPVPGTMSLGPEPGDLPRAGQPGRRAASTGSGQCYGDDDDDEGYLRQAPAERAAGAQGLSGPSEAASGPCGPTVSPSGAEVRASW